MNSKGFSIGVVLLKFIGENYSMLFTLVPMQEEYIEGFWKAVDSVAREKKYLAFLQAPCLESTRAFVLDNLKNRRPSFLAIVEGEVVGWCDLMDLGRPIFSHVGELGMGIKAPFRGQGIGKALIERLIQEAKNRSYTRLELSVREPNIPAISLYKKMGFEIEGVKKRHACVDSVYEDVFWMALLLK